MLQNTVDLNMAARTLRRTTRKRHEQRDAAAPPLFGKLPPTTSRITDLAARPSSSTPCERCTGCGVACRYNTRRRQVWSERKAFCKTKLLHNCKKLLHTNYTQKYYTKITTRKLLNKKWCNSRKHRKGFFRAEPLGNLHRAKLHSAKLHRAKLHSQVTLHRAKLHRAKLHRPELHRAPSYIEPSYMEPSYIELSYIEPSYIEPSYIEPSYTELSYIEPSYTEPNGT